ncbi:MAG: RagB/SusD family nutrient uptake outer membrane protein [Cytophagales bacterium]|nr:RagB/SusD family nutrient uptake outer membrane protein [Cytophagales bacterium]
MKPAGPEQIQDAQGQVYISLCVSKLKKYKRMKKLNIYIASCTLALVVFACNDDYLERYPLDELTNETFWQSENDLKAYTAGLYTLLDAETVWWDDQSDNQAEAAYDEVVAGQHTISTGTWSWSFLRDCNFFLENYDKSDEVSDDVKDEYKGEVLFFRATFTFDRIKTYGDIPFTTKVITNEDQDVLYGPRTPRKEVMDQVKEDLEQAIGLIPANRSEEGRVTKWAALAMTARIALHEGTFRKYHKLGGEEEWLKLAADAASQVIDNGGFSLYTTGNPDLDYRNLFIQLSLNGNPEAILHKKYLAGEKGHNFIRYMVESHQDGLTKDMVNDYLCTDGKPIGLSPLFRGDDLLEDEFANRDPRLLQTIVPPGTGFFIETSDDEVVPRLPQAKGHGSATTTGYHIIKMYDNDEVSKYSDAETDLFLIRYAEVLLIYAEARAELGEADQSVIDMTINKLRERVGMPPMVIGGLQRDPDSDMTAAAGYLEEEVSVLIEEIRRERRVELASEGFRYDDLMRWRAGKFLTKKTLGAKWSAFKDRTTVDGVPIYDEVVVGTDIFLDENGYIDLYQNQLPGGKVFDPNKHYYFSIPLGELALNPNLTQNPGWEE